MKKLYLLSTRPWIYLSEIPLTLLLIFAIQNNAEAAGVWHLYPLIITTILGMVFILLYFFKVLIISTDEVESFSIFQGRDSATLNKGKTLIIGKISEARIKVCVFGNDGAPPDIDYVKNDKEYTPIDIFLLRGKALGGAGTLVRIMNYFDIPAETARALTETDGVYEDEAVAVSSALDTLGNRELKITFKKTL